MIKRRRPTPVLVALTGAAIGLLVLVPLAILRVVERSKDRG